MTRSIGKTAGNFNDSFCADPFLPSPEIRENEKLKSKIGELTMTIDLLKKVEAWKKQQTSAASSIITSRNLDQFG